MLRIATIATLFALLAVSHRPVHAQEARAISQSIVQEAARAPMLRTDGAVRLPRAEMDRRRTGRDSRYEDDRRRPSQSRGPHDWRRNERRYESRTNGKNRSARGPKFCQNGSGHPVHGMQWCRDKGFGRYGDIRSERRDRRSERHPFARKK